MSSFAVRPKAKIAVVKAKMFPHLQAWVRVGCGIPHAKDFISLSLQRISAIKTSR
jgi:hypothetical protein